MLIQNLKIIAPNCKLGWGSLVSRKYCFHHHYWINFRWTKSFSHFLLKVSFSVVPSNGVQSSCSDACKGEVISEGIFDLVPSSENKPQLSEDEGQWFYSFYFWEWDPNKNTFWGYSTFNSVHSSCSSACKTIMVRWVQLKIFLQLPFRS